MKVYGHPMSTCTRKVLATLVEKGQQADFVMVDIMKGEHKQPAHLARQPFGVVPAFEDDGLHLYESRAIIRYLDEKFPTPSLSPRDMKDRARMEQYFSIEQSYFSAPTLKIFSNLVLAKMMGREPDMAVVDQAKGEVARTLDIVEKDLGNREYLAGSSFSLADIDWMPYVQYLFPPGMGSMVTDRPHFGAWWKRVSTRPSWVKVAG